MNLVNVDRVAVFGDLHCGVHSDSTFWYKIGKEWAKWFKEELDKKEINTVIFLGDYFHNRTDVSVSTLQHAADILGLWKDLNLIFIIGNHDCQNKNNTDINSVAIFQGWNNIHVVKSSESLNIGGKVCSFVSWGHGLNHIDDSDYLFGHFEINSFKMNNYKVCEKGISSADLFKKSPIVFSGHFHHRDERSYDRNRKIIYAGNPFEMDFGDLSNQKGYYTIDLKRDIIRFWENNISPQHLKVKYSEYSEENNLHNKIVRLIIDKKIPVDQVDKIVANISKRSPLQLSIEYLYNDTPELSDNTHCDLSSIDRGKAIEEFINLLDINNKIELNNICQELYNNL